MSPRSHLLLISAGLLSLGAVAIAQPPAPPHGGMGMMMAPPADRAELKAMLEKHFDMIDANHDGTVTPEERKAAHQAMAEKMRQQMFDRMDANKDNMISRAEFDAMHGPDAPHHDAMSPGPGPDGPRGHHMRRHGKGMDMGPGAMWNSDKPVTRAQFIDAGLARFDRADSNHDGKISDAERDAARKAMRDRLAPADRPPPPPPGQ